MNLAASDVLVVDEGASAIFRRGRVALKFDNPGTIAACKAILAAFAAPGGDAETFLARFPEPLRPALLELIDTMRERGFLVASDAEKSADGIDVFWSDFGSSPDRQTQIAASISLFLVGRNALSRSIAELLVQSGYTIAGLVDDPDLAGHGAFDADWQSSDGWTLPDEAANPVIIAATDLGAETCLRGWNEFAIRAGVSFLPASIKDHIGYVGPFVIPGHKPCYECARGRVNANHHDAAGLRAGESKYHTVPGAFGLHPLLLQMTAASTVSELLRATSGALPPKPSARLTIDPFHEQSIRAHRILRLPRCPACALARDHAPPLYVRNEDTQSALIEAFR